MKIEILQHDIIWANPAENIKHQIFHPDVKDFAHCDSGLESISEGAPSASILPLPRTIGLSSR